MNTKREQKATSNRSSGVRKLSSTRCFFFFLKWKQTSLLIVSKRDTSSMYKINETLKKKDAIFVQIF